MAGLPERMKDYEAVYDQRIIGRCPAIIRVDGRAFHTWTRGLEKPFDAQFRAWMNAVACTLCHEISTARFAYVQSDEISVLLTDYVYFNTEQWFGGRVQKMCSVAAAIAAMRMNRVASNRDGATFDARVFSLPREDVVNYFVWRQRDCIRNSILGFAQSQMSPSQMHGIDCDKLAAMTNWETETSDEEKRGYAIRKDGLGWRTFCADKFGEDRREIQEIVNHCEECIDQKGGVDDGK